MKWFRSFLPSVALVLGLAACAPTAANLGDDLKSVSTGDKGAAQALADQLLGEVIGHDNRALRMCMIVAGGSILLSDAAKQQPDIAPAALGHIVSLKGSLKVFDGADGVFMETDITLATLAMTQVATEVVKQRIPALVALAAGGFNVGGIVDEAKLVARRTALTAAIIRDIRALFVAIGKGETDAATARASCEARIDASLASVATILGATAIASPSP